MKKGKKVTGGRYRKQRKKKKQEREGKQTVVKLGPTKKKTVKVLGGNTKTYLLSTDSLNLVIEKGKAIKVKIKNVLETPANRFLARQNILMKGAIVETEKGKARITNRPGKEPSIQAILLEEDKQK